MLNHLKSYVNTLPLYTRAVWLVLHLLQLVPYFRAMATNTVIAMIEFRDVLSENDALFL